MRDLITILESPQNYLYAFFICVAIGVWLVSLLGFVKDFHWADKDFSMDADVRGIGLESFAKWLGFGSIPASILITLLLFFQG